MQQTLLNAEMQGNNYAIAMISFDEIVKEY